MNNKPWFGRNQVHTLSPEERFWEKVEIRGSNDCWNWWAGCTNNGYGAFIFKGKSNVSNRVTWLITFGIIPDDMCVLHKCDNRKCCNPNHLFLGTTADNNKDRHAKGRDSIVRGENSPNAKITMADANEIRRLYSTGLLRYIDIAPMFKIKKSLVGNIINNESWGG